MNSLWLIPVLPLLGAAFNGIIGKRLPKKLVGTVAVGTVAVSFLISASVFREPVNANYFTWIRAGGLEAHFGLMVDHLSGLMILIVTGVGLLIHIYSVGYMYGDPGFYRYFAYLNLFMFSMLMLVLANNYLLMFVGWEGVGLCSYLLIGFWFFKKTAADAGKKAFVVNRIGDFGFILAMLLIFWTFESLDFQTVFSQVTDGTIFPVEPLGNVGVITTICLLMLVGATGKSAQVPLYVWLPDAMEGPTPVSALIHAATMVTAGVYMIARSAALFDHAPGALLVVAAVGAFTAIFSASMGLVQTDIKRILAYSTVSQLGYMFLACGVGAYTAGMFHLMTHAFFKALLFLGAGSVIHGIGGIQDIRKMGGIRRQMPWTFWTFLIGTLAIAGIPGFSGFFSKDAILEAAFYSANYGRILWFAGLMAAAFTSFYIFRLLILTFFGEPRYTQDVHHVHESPASMVVPLVILAVLSAGAGYFGNVGAVTGVAGVEPTPRSTDLLLTAAATLVAFVGLGLAYLFYIARPDLPAKLAAGAHATYGLLVNKYYIDEIYDAILVWPIVVIAREFLWRFIDVFMVDGGVNSIGKIVRGSAGALRHMQTGYVRTYVGWILFGGILVVAWFLR
jgi:NADH-quinone oxidoreductase subunit L